MLKKLAFSAAVAVAIFLPSVQASNAAVPSPAASTCSITFPTLGTVVNLRLTKWTLPKILWEADIKLDNGTVHVQEYAGRPHLFLNDRVKITACSDKGVERVS